MELKLPIVRPDLETKQRAGFGFRVGARLLAMALSLPVLLWRSNFTVPIAVLVLFILMRQVERILRRLYPDWVRRKDLVGDVTFGADHIKLAIGDQRRSITLRWSTRVHLDTHHIQGKKRVYRDYLRNGIGTLTVSNGPDEVKVKFLVRTKTELRDLTEILKAWYRNGIPVHETMEERSMGVFLMKSDWKFQELQAAKKEYGL